VIFALEMLFLFFLGVLCILLCINFYLYCRYDFSREQFKETVKIFFENKE